MVKPDDGRDIPDLMKNAGNAPERKVPYGG